MKDSFSVKFSDVLDWFRRIDHRNEEVAYIGRHTSNTIGLFFYPIFIFLMAGQYTQMGSMISASLLVGSFTLFIAGKIKDNSDKSNFIFNLGALSATIIWVLRSFVYSFWQLFALDLSMKTIIPFYAVPFDSMVYERSRGNKERVLTFMVAREIFIGAVYFIVLGLVALAAPYEWRWSAIFSIAALGVVISTVMWEGD